MAVVVVGRAWSVYRTLLYSSSFTEPYVAKSKHAAQKLKMTLLRKTFPAWLLYKSASVTLGCCLNVHRAPKTLFFVLGMLFVYVTDVRVVGTRRVDMEHLGSKPFSGIQNMHKVKAMALRCVALPVLRYVSSSTTTTDRIPIFR
jgi:hypothetical protein